MFKRQYKQLIDVDEIELKPSDLRKSRYIVTASSRFAFSAVASRFPQLLKCDNRYGSILPRITLLATLLCLASYEQCSTRLLKMLHKHCNTDMLGVLLIYPHSPLGAACLWDCAYIYQSNPSLLCYNLLMYVHQY